LTIRRFLSFSSASVVPIFVVGLTLSFALPCRAQLPIVTSQAAPSSEMSQQVDELQKVVDRWDDAVTQRDQYGLELVLAPQFINISDTGQVMNRDELISEMLQKDQPRVTFAQKVTNVRVVGDVAVVNGTYDRLFQASRLSRAKSKDENGVFSQVYIRARTSWECINSQRTIVVVTMDKTRKKSKEKSNAKPLHHDLGFHLPGLHHDSNSQPQ